MLEQATSTFGVVNNGDVLRGLHRQDGVAPEKIVDNPFRRLLDKFEAQFEGHGHGEAVARTENVARTAHYSGTAIKAGYNLLNAAKLGENLAQGLTDARRTLSDLAKGQLGATGGDLLHTGNDGLKVAFSVGSIAELGVSSLNSASWLAQPEHIARTTQAARRVLDLVPLGALGKNLAGLGDRLAGFMRAGSRAENLGAGLEGLSGKLGKVVDVIEGNVQVSKIADALHLAEIGAKVPLFAKLAALGQVTKSIPLVGIAASGVDFALNGIDLAQNRQRNPVNTNVADVASLVSDAAFVGAAVTPPPLDAVCLAVAVGAVGVGLAAQHWTQVRAGAGAVQHAAGQVLGNAGKVVSSFSSGLSHA